MNFDEGGLFADDDLPGLAYWLAPFIGRDLSDLPAPYLRLALEAALARIDDVQLEELRSAIGDEH